MTKNVVAKNYIYNLSYQILNLITPLITAPFLARTLGAESLGINSYTYSIVYWFIIFAMMGIAIYGNKEIAKVSNDREKITKTFSEILCLQISNILVVLGIFYIVFFNFNFNYKDAFLLQGLMILTYAFDISWLYNGLEDFKKIMLRNFVCKIAQIFFIFLLIRNPSQYLLYISILVAMNFVSNIIMWINIRKYTGFKIPKPKAVYSRIKETFILFIPQIATTIYSVFDQTMIGLLYRDVKEVAYYAQAHKFVNMFLFFTTTIGTVMLPRIVKRRANDENDKVKEMTNKTLKIALFLSMPIAFGLAAIAPFFVSWFLTEEFEKVGYLMSAMSPIIIFISVTNVLGTQYMIPNDKYKKYTLSVTCGCVVNLLLNFIVIPKFGAFGAVISSVITEFFILAFQYFTIRKEFNFEGIKGKTIKYFVCAATMGAIMLIVGNYFGACVLGNIVQFTVGVLVYGAILLILKDDMLFLFIDKILKLLHIRKEVSE